LIRVYVGGRENKRACEKRKKEGEGERGGRTPGSRNLCVFQGTIRRKRRVQDEERERAKSITGRETDPYLLHKRKSIRESRIISWSPWSWKGGGGKLFDHHEGYGRLGKGLNWRGRGIRPVTVSI